MTVPFVVAGEALVDIVRAPDAEPVEAVGGSPMNVAVGLARLGVPALLLTRVGDDDRGRRVVEHLRDSGVRLGDRSMAPGAPTSTATARLDPRGAADYDFEITWDLPAERLPQAIGLHVGSLGTVLEPGRGAVLDLVAQGNDRGLPVSFDPNVRPAFMPDAAAAWDQVRDLAGSCTLVKLSDEDLSFLVPGRAILEAASELLAGRRTELVLVTRGGKGAWATTGERTVEMPAPATTVVDTVGAGDSFMAATLAALHDADRLRPGRLRSLDDDGLAGLLRAAMTVAAVTCARRGANPPTLREVPPGWPALR